MMWQPTMRCSGPTQTSFMSVWVLRVVIAWYIGVKSATYTFTASPYWARASASLAPTVPIGGCVNTTVGIMLYSKRRSVLPPNSRSLKRRPAAIATGVKAARPVTSPIA